MRFLIFFLVASVVSAQSLRIARERIASGFGFIDDVEVTPLGQVLVSLPQIPEVAFLDLTTGSTTPLIGRRVHGMALDPSGASLWIGDWSSGELLEVDLASGAILRTVTGIPGRPLEIVFLQVDRLLVGTVDVPDFVNGVGSIHDVQLLAGGGAAVTLLSTGFAGGVDVAANSEGRVFAAALVSPQLEEILLPSGSRVPIQGGLFQPSDILAGPGRTLYVSTLLGGEVLRIDPGPASLTGTATTAQVGFLLGEAIGPGCEDMAFESAANDALLVSLNNGELWRVRVLGDLRQEGAARYGGAFALWLDVPSAPGQPFSLAASFSTVSGPTSSPSGTHLYLTIDPLFVESLSPTSPFFTGFSGVLDPSGVGVGIVALPSLGIPPFDVYFQAGIFSGASVLSLTDAVAVTLFP